MAPLRINESTRAVYAGLTADVRRDAGATCGRRASRVITMIEAPEAAEHIPERAVFTIAIATAKRR
jgi:hypothetical protein